VGMLGCLIETINVFTWVKLYTVEIASTVVFVVFITVEAIRAIKHLIGSVRKE